MYAIYSIQPDDANHLEIYSNEGKRIIYLRVYGNELKSLLNGDATFVETGVWAEDVKRDYYKVAELFKQGKIEYIIFQNYPGVKPFKYKVTPENIEIEKHGLFKTTYILRLEDKTVKIETSVRNPMSGYPFTVSVTEFARTKRPVKTTSTEALKHVYNELKNIQSMLTIDPKKTKKKELVQLIIKTKIKIIPILATLREIIEEGK